MTNYAKRFVSFFARNTLFAVSTGLVLLWPVFGVTPVSAQMQMKQGMQMEMAKEGIFEGQGEIIAIVTAKHQVVLQHGEIKGFMGPMTMGYAVASDALMKDLKPGDSVKFKIDAANKQIIAMERMK